MGIRPSIDGETDCHVGPMALLAMTDHGAADVECDEPVGRGIPDAPPGVICPASLSYRRGGACSSRRVCTAPFDWGGFRRPGGEPLLERSKRGEKIAGVCSGGHPALTVTAPRTPFTGELGSGVWWKCTGAGWPLTHNRSPARCHCAAKPEGCFCYPFRTRLPWCSPVMRRMSNVAPL